MVDVFDFAPPMLSASANHRRHSERLSGICTFTDTAD